MSQKGTITTSDYLPYEEYLRLVECLENDHDYRGAVYCILSFSLALRISDVLKIKWNQVIGQDHIVTTEKKTKKTKNIPIGNNTSAHIKDLYKKMRSPDFNGNVVRSKKGEDISREYINRWLKQCKKKYNLQIGNFSSHTFRKTFGRYVYNKMGQSQEALILLNRIFRHHNVATTMIYLGLRDDEIGDIFNNL